MDMKITMVKAFGWNLHDINQTDIVELLYFVKRVNGASGEKIGVNQRVYCDDVSWL